MRTDAQTIRKSAEKPSKVTRRRAILQPPHPLPKNRKKVQNARETLSRAVAKRSPPHGDYDNTATTTTTGGIISFLHPG